MSRFEVGQLVRIVKASGAVFKRDIGRLMTVRYCANVKARIDDGDPANSDGDTNGMRMGVWARVGCIVAVGS